MEYGMILKLNLNYINQISIASRGRNFRGAEQVCEWLLQGRNAAARTELASRDLLIASPAP